MSAAPGTSAMTAIVSAPPGTITAHPPGSTKEQARKGVWQGQMTFIPDALGEVVGVSFTIWDGQAVPAPYYKPPMGPVSQGYSHVVYRLTNVTNSTSAAAERKRICAPATREPPILGECCPGGPLSGPCGGGDDSWCQGVNGSSELPLSCQARNSSQEKRQPVLESSAVSSNLKTDDDGDADSDQDGDDSDQDGDDSNRDDESGSIAFRACQGNAPCMERWVWGWPGFENK
jgi:hypothetical protein